MNADGLFRGPDAMPVSLERIEFMVEMEKIFHGARDGINLAGSNRRYSTST